MNRTLRLVLQADPSQMQRLAALQGLFADACNALAPLVQQTRCWNRVALHHMAYKALRQQFPGIGSQMVCNAIYSVSRTSRLVYQHPQSPFNVARLGGRPLPLLKFMPMSPVYFDRHTLSVKAGEISMYTLDGRMRFQAGLASSDEERFRDEKLREVVLTREKAGYALTFTFGPDPAATALPHKAADTQTSELPEYLVVVDMPPLPAPPTSLSTAHAPSP